MSTTYTFIGKPNTQFVAWNDPTVWSGGLIPNGADAVVVVPTIYASNVIYTSFLTIGIGQSYAAQSVSVTNNFVELMGSLAISDALVLSTGGEIDMSNATLSFGSLQNNGNDIQGSGQVSSTNSIVNAGKIVSSGVLNLTFAGFENTGQLIASESTLNLVVTGGPGADSNYSNGTLTGGSYEAEDGGVLNLQIGGTIATDAASLSLTVGVYPAPSGIEGSITSYDPISNTYVPLETTLQTIAPSGTLALYGGTYTTGNTLVVDGMLALNSGPVLSTAELVMAAGSTITGNGTIAGPVLNGTTIESMLSGPLVLQGPVSGTGLLEVGPGSVYKGYFTTGSGTVKSSTLELGGPTAQNVTFADNTGILLLDDPQSFTGTIAAQLLGPYHDTITLAGISYASVTGESYTGTAAGGTLTITEGATTQTLNFTGDYTVANFILSAGPQALSSYPPSLNITIACYVGGTLIRTNHGDRPVETLCIGDHVTTRDGASRPIKWIGHRHVDCNRHPRPETVWPVRVLTDTFAPGMPQRDLLLSADHAVFVDGILIPIKYLINGATILQEARDEVTYWHIELERHDVILAEGLACESYLDDGSPSVFTNAESVVQLHPDLALAERCEVIWESQGCAPLRIEGEAVARVDARLRRRAARLGRTLAKPIRKAPRRAAKRIVPSIDLAELFQLDRYLTGNPDVAARGVDPAAHNVGWCLREGRLPCSETDLVRALGLIDPATVVATMTDVVAIGMDPADHFCAYGWRERRRPNVYFDTGWYLDAYDVPEGVNPLVHYVLFGEDMGLSPSQHFDPGWYRQRYAIPPTVSALAHYLAHRRTQQVGPLPSFDVAAYVQTHAATLLPNRDPYAHFLAIGQSARDGEQRAAA